MSALRNKLKNVMENRRKKNIPVVGMASKEKLECIA